MAAERKDVHALRSHLQLSTSPATATANAIQCLCQHTMSTLSLFTLTLLPHSYRISSTCERPKTECYLLFGVRSTVDAESFRTELQAVVSRQQEQ
jgi:hypothetical protein